MDTALYHSYCSIQACVPPLSHPCLSSSSLGPYLLPLASGDPKFITCPSQTSPGSTNSWISPSLQPCYLPSRVVDISPAISLDLVHISLSLNLSAYVSVSLPLSASLCLCLCLSVSLCLCLSLSHRERQRQRDTHTERDHPLAALCFIGLWPVPAQTKLGTTLSLIALPST